MATFGLQLNAPLALDSYQRLLAAVPAGQDNLTADIVVPSHAPQSPISFVVSNVTPGIPHVLHATASWGIAPQPTVTFVPSSDTAIVTIALAYGPNSIVIQDSLGNRTYFSVAVTHYAAIFLAEATELTNYSWTPINNIQNAISSPLGYLLGTPFIGDFTKYIPTDLETLYTLGSKLLVKSLLWGPGQDQGVAEIFASFAASNPYIFRMQNQGTPETFLYRNEESFAGYEAHLWLPNREVERWVTFIRYLDNLPQVYSIRQINEGEVYVEVGDKVYRHVFDFESDFANTVLEGAAVNSCFANLFRLDITVKSSMIVSFCEASYVLDGAMPPLLTPDADPLGVRNWTSWSLTGRFEQQLGADDGIHGWVYESPLPGAVDGINRFFTVSQQPANAQSMKLFVDGLLQRYLLDYRISNGDSFRSDVYALSISPSPILIDAQVGEPRPFVAPVFATVEVDGGGDAEFLVTATTQSLSDVTFVVSEPPASASSSQAARLHYVTPALPASSYAGGNQYGTVAIPANTVVFSLTFPTPATSIGYQLLVQYGDDPAEIPSKVDQPHWIVRNHTLTGAIVEFASPVVAPNAVLHWWLIEGPVGLESGTLPLSATSLTQVVPFTGGPYTDQVIVILSLWNSTATGSIDMPFWSVTNLNTVSFTAQFSNPIPTGNYYLDYAVFPSEIGNLLELFAPPRAGQVVEAQYDTIWQGWINSGPLQQVDGVTRAFTLPAPCPIPDAMYATLDGRLLRQGANEQYVIDPDRVTVRFANAPQQGQEPWFVYPTLDPVTSLPPPSSWRQGSLGWGSPTSGAYATGKVLNAAAITPGDSVTVGGETYVAQQTASGSVFNPSAINPGDFLTFVERGVTLNGVLFYGYVPPKLLGTLPASVDVDVATNTITLDNHGILDNTVVYLWSSETMPSGVAPFTRYYVVNVTADTFQLSTSFSGPPVQIREYDYGVPYAAHPATVTGASYSASGTLVTVSTISTSSYRNGQLASVSSGTDANVDGTYPITVTSGTTFTYTASAAPSVASGTLDYVAGATIVVTVPDTSNYFTGMPITVSAGSDAEVNGSFTVAVTSPTTFTYEVLDAPPSLSGSLNYVSLSPGSGVLSVASGALPTEFPVGKTRDADAQALAAAINANLGDSYLATFQGSGLTVIRALALGNGASNQTLAVGIGATPSIQATNIVGDSAASADEVQSITFAPVPDAGKFNLSFAGNPTVDIAWDASASDVAGALNSLPDLRTVRVSGSVASGFTVDFAAADGNQAQPLLALADNRRSFVPASVDPVTNRIFIPRHGFVQGQSAGFFTTGTLPAGLSPGTAYHLFNATTDGATYFASGTTVMVTGVDTTGYFDGMTVTVFGGTDEGVDGTYAVAVLSPTSFTYTVPDAPTVTSGSLNYVDGNYLQVTTAPPEVSVVQLVDQGSGVHTVALNCLSAAGVPVTPAVTEVTRGFGNRFPSGIGREQDSRALADAMNASGVTGRMFAASASPGVVTLTSRLLGTSSNVDVSVTGASMRSSGIGGGVDFKQGSQPLTTPGIFYYADAPVVALDGLSTRRYEGYGGSSVSFGMQPEPVQSPYMVTQVYPVDHHPLDSLAANQPSSYPKGVFTQALNAQLTEFDLDVPETGTLTITVQGQPLQEAPAGAIDGINKVFNLTLTSCNGQNSLMVWVDGMFQNPTLYSYSEVSGHGQITLANAPEPGQILWVWYLIASDGCANEHVEQLTGAVDGSNATFGVPNSPWADKPTLLVFLQGLLSIQDVDYAVDVSGTSITYGQPPGAGLSLWAHMNTGAAGSDKWLQLAVGTGDGTQIEWALPTLISSQLPRSKDSVILAMDGLVQREGVDFTVDTDITGAPNGFITFASAPGAGQVIQVAYMTKG